MSQMFSPTGAFQDPICRPVQGSFRKFELLEDYETPEHTVKRIGVDGQPFTFDLSVPRILYAITPPMGPWLAAMCVHDDMYERAIGSKKFADKVFKRNLKRGRVGGFLRFCMYHSVRIGGDGAY